jgi:hypothetical protein
MKSTLYILTLLITLTFFSCKKDLTKNATVIKDCTGTYMRMNGKDYKVCNIEKVSSFQNSITVLVSFKEQKDCEGSGNIVQTCYMLHQFESWIEIENIK